MWLAVTVVVGGAAWPSPAARRRWQAVDNQSSRTTLISRIDAEREVLAETQTRVGRLEASIAELQAEDERLAAEAGRRLDAELRRIRIRTGYVAGHRPRRAVPSSTTPPGVDPDEAVRDEDLALLVNGLWTAGAEAIAINDQRLTALTYIQNSGQVDQRQLPAAAAAVRRRGHRRPAHPPGALHGVRRAARGSTTSPDVLGFEFDRQNEDQLQLPGAGLRQLRYATAGRGRATCREAGRGGGYGVIAIWA